MSPTSQSRQSSYSGRGGMLDVHPGIVNPSGSPQPQYNSSTSTTTSNPKFLGSGTNALASPSDPSAGLRGPPRISSAYRRTLETHAGNQSCSIDLDTFEVPCPLSAPSPRVHRFASPSASGEGGNAPLVDERSRRKASLSSNNNNGGVSSNVPSAVGDVPDLGVVDLSDGKNKERPQRFKAVIHFKRKDRQPAVPNQDGSP